MKTFLLVMRCGLEGILGVLLILVFLSDIPKSIIGVIRLFGAENGKTSVAEVSGMVIGMFIMGFFGYLAIRDAIKIGRRIQTKPQTIQNPD
jgi:hypothetical protein